MHRLSAIIACAASAFASSLSLAQPRLVITELGTDLNAAGNGVVGLAYDNRVQQYRPYFWTLSSGYSLINAPELGGNLRVLCSGDMTSLAISAANTANWGNLNCFGGYCWANSTGCIPGEPLPDRNGCAPPAITHHWNSATGWVNAGSFPRILDSATGRYYGGTRCDFDINSPNDLSGNGRYAVGGAWSAPLHTANGGPGYGLCGNFYGFVYDSATGNFQQLPSQYGTARADVVNFDGTVVTGYDLDPNQSLRRMVVWRNGVETILDPYLGAKDNAAVNASGTMVSTGASSQFVATTFPGQTGVRLVRWTYQSGTWVPTNLGKPAPYLDPNSGVGIAATDMRASAMSDDGNTIIGTAQYGAAPPSTSGLQRPFIWSPAINGGLPIDLEQYVISLAGTSTPFFREGFTLNYVTKMSGDGNAILVSIYDATDTCPGFTPRSLDTFHTGILYLNGSNVPCQSPRIGLGPVNTESSQYTPFGVALNVVASGSWPLSFQWQREDENNPGFWNNLTESCMNFDRVVNWDYEGVFKNQLRVGEGFCGSGRAGNYRVIVSNTCGSVTSDAAAVTFNQVPWVYRSPVSVGGCASGTATFALEARGTTPYYYQWQIADASAPAGWADLNDGFIMREGLPAGRIIGANLDSLAWFGEYADGEPNYYFKTHVFRCIISNECGGSPSQAAALSLCACFACPADFNQDGGVDGGDIESFFTAFSIGDCDADVNDDGGVDGSDIESFFTSWQSGGC